MDVFERAYGVVEAHDLVPVAAIDTQGEPAERVGNRPEVRLVVRGRVQADDDTVRALEDDVVSLARRRFRPAELTVEAGHPLHVLAGERDEVDPGGERYFASFQSEPTPRSTASGGSSG